MANTEVNIAGLKLRNPVIPAAGPNVKDGKYTASAAEGGAGALLAKTVSRKAALVPRPNMARYASKSMLNTELWTELSLEQWLDAEYDIAIAQARKSNIPLIASIGYTAEDVAHIGPLLEKKGIDAIEFSIHYLGKTFDGALNTAKALRKAVKVPIIAKLSPHSGDMGELVRVLEPHVDAFACINSFGPVLSIDINKCEPIMGSEMGYGWLSGEALKPIALRCVFEVAKATKKPVIGVGGITKCEDAIEYFMAGAWAVGICTAAILKGPSVYGSIARGVSNWLDKKGYKDLSEIRGLYVKKYGKGQRVVRDKEESVQLDIDKCVACSACARVCWYGALEAPPKTKAKVNASKCFQCGLCASVCPSRALFFKSRDLVTKI
ncbi:4Fe-4S binding protein [Elusimicrobiota bacterium]